MPWPRAILHVDMDAFFASVEQRDDPSLRGRPVLVGGGGPRGVVAAASYEARAFGCHSAMPTARALRLCPHAIVVKGSFDKYRQASRVVMGILGDLTPLVQPLSIDEAFCDVTGSQRLLGTPPAMARGVRERVLAETRLTCSVGVASSKFMAKLASDLDKPDGLTVVEPGTEQATLDPLPVGKIWGVGPRTEAYLRDRGVRTVAELRRLPDDFFDRRLGKMGAKLRDRIHARDERPVVPEHEAKQVSHEKTFGVDVADPDVARAVLLGQVEDVAERLRRRGARARGVTLKLRLGDFTTFTRSRALREPTNVTRELWRAALDVFDAWSRGGFRPLRLLGFGTAIAGGDGQLGLFDDGQSRQRGVDAVADAIRGRFGKDALRRAGASRGSTRGSGDARA